MRGDASQEAAIAAGERVARDLAPASRPDAVVRLAAKPGFALCKLVGRLRFRQLSLLVALDEQRNLHRAAKAVHLAQPSASKLVHDLELLFGGSLFDRSSIGMQPTELGAVVVAFARRSLNDLKRLATDLEQRRAGRDGQFVIGTAADVLPRGVARAMADMKQRRPTLAIKLLGDASEKVIDRLIEGQSDLALGYFSGDPLRTEIDYEVISIEGMGVVAREHHPLASHPSLDMIKLESTAWIVNPQANSTCQILERIFLRSGMQAPTNLVESHSLSMTLDLLMSGDAVTILPVCVARHHLHSGQLVRLPVSMGEYSIEFGLLRRRGERLCSAALEFSELLHQFSGCSDRKVGAALMR